MRAFLPKSFQREAKSHGISDDECREAVRKAESAWWMRLSVGDCSSSGSREAARELPGDSERLSSIGGVSWRFSCIFSRKSDKANLTKSELTEYLKLAEFLEKLTEVKLKELGTTRGWRELDN